MCKCVNAREVCVTRANVGDATIDLFICGFWISGYGEEGIDSPNDEFRRRTRPSFNVHIGQESLINLPWYGDAV
jgi:hypothetical protein